MNSENYFATYSSSDPPYITEDYEQNKLLDQELKKSSPGPGLIDLLDISENDKQQIKRGLPVSEPGEFRSVFNKSFNPTIKMSTGSKSLNEALDRQGITGTKRNCLIKIAKVESGMNQYATARGSSASGMFQMIDSTRQSVSSVSKKEFMNNLDEQVRAASKLYDKNLAMLRNNRLLEKAKTRGLSTDEVVAMSWLNPSWTKNYLETGNIGGSDANGTNIIKYLKLYRSK